MSKTFASQNDLEEKKASFTQIGDGAYAYTTEGDPNSGVIIGEEAVMVIEAQATPQMAKDVIAKIRTVTNKPLKHLVLTHYHAVRVLGAAAYEAEEIIMSEKTLDLVKERGKQDWLSEFQRFPRLFRGHESIQGLTFPSLTFKENMTVDLGNKVVEIMHLGEGHTKGDAIVWLPKEKILFAGDLVEFNATPYCGDAQLSKWPRTLDILEALDANALVPGRGEALLTKEDCKKAIHGTRDYVSTLFSIAQKSIENNESLKACHDAMLNIMRPKFGEWVIFEHCMCFNASRAYDEAKGIEHPRIWTAERDLEMWKELNPS